jgi:SAM-dependent methyltransferase
VDPGMGEAFTRAYKDGRWHHGSGSGSSPANTREYRRFLAAYMQENRIRSVLDIGCGDWQFSRLIDWTGIDYLGVDVVPAVIGHNWFRYARPTIRFEHGDVLNGYQLPDVDLILCKDLFQHWPDEAIHELGSRLADGAGPHARRALLTYDLSYEFTDGPHSDIEPGGYRPLDLTAPPFGWALRERLRYASVSHEGRVRRIKVVMELAP